MQDFFYALYFFDASREQAKIENTILFENIPSV